MRRVTPLKLAIVASGRRQKDIATEAGLDETTLSRIVNGLHADELTRLRIADALHRDAGDLWPEDVAA